MIIVIQYIPSSTTELDIHNFVDPALKKFGVVRLGKIEKIDILALLNKPLRYFKCYSIVQINSKVAGQIAIKKLNGTRFKNRFVTVRKYSIRSVHNDSRNRDSFAGIEDRRMSDRRLNSRSKIYEAKKLLQFATAEEGLHELDEGEYVKS
jgi:hypothetical protein